MNDTALMTYFEQVDSREEGSLIKVAIIGGATLQVYIVQVSQSNV